jgi:hypothetical protein
MYHGALQNICYCCTIRLVLVRLTDLHRTNDDHVPIDKLVEVHDKCVLVHSKRTVVLGEPEVIKLGIRCVRMSQTEGSWY